MSDNKADNKDCKDKYIDSIERNGRIYGFKAANLIYLQEEIIEEFISSENDLLAQTAIKIQVPAFLPLAGNIIKQHLDQYAHNFADLLNNFKASYQQQLDKGKFDPDTEESRNKIEQCIIDTLSQHPLSMNKELTQQIQTFLDKNNIRKDQLLMIRSTGVNEDKADMANAGGNESFPCKAHLEVIVEVMTQVAASYFSEKSLSQRLIAGDKSITDFPVMPILAQKMIKAALSTSQELAKIKERIVYSGVMYSSILGATSLQVAPGHGEYVVNSKGPTDEYHISENDLISKIRCRKDFRIQEQQDANGKIHLVRVDNNSSVRDVLSLDDNTVFVLHQLAKFIVRKYNKPMDIEFVFEPVSNTIYIVQARAIPEGRRKGLEPSAVAPKFLVNHADELKTIKALQVVTPKVNKAMVITNKEQVIISHAIKEALDQYNKLGKDNQVKVGIIQEPSPSTSHEAAVFNNAAVLIMQVNNLEQVRQLLETGGLVIMDPQRSKIYQLPDKIFAAPNQTNIEQSLYDQNILAKGLYASPLSPYVTTVPYVFPPYEFLSKEQIAIKALSKNKTVGQLLAEAKLGNLESTTRLLSIAAAAAQYRQARYEQEQLAAEEPNQPRDKRFIDNLEKLTRAQLGSSNRDTKLGLAYVLRGIYNFYKEGNISQELFQEIMLHGATLFEYLNEMKKLRGFTEVGEQEVYSGYLNIQKKFTGLITSNKEKNIFSSSLVIERAERTKENLSQQQIDKYEQENNYQFSVTQKEYLIQLLKLGQYAISNNEGKAWQDFCFDVSSTSKTQQIKTMADAAIALATRERNTNQLADLVDKVVSYDIQSKWLNIVFMEKVLEYRLKPPTAILRALEEDFNQLKLEPIKQANNLIKEMIAQIPLWEEANKFPRLYEEFKEKIQQINPDLQWNPEASSLEKILKLENLDTLTDTLDKINKSLEHSSNYQDPQGKDLEDDKGNNLQAARFLLLVTQFYGVMKIWIKHNEFENVEPYLEQMEQLLIQKKNQILTKEEFNPSPNFAVNTSTINVPGNESRRVTYKTLEDFLTLTHQNGKTIIAKLSEPHCRIIINQCPDLVKNLNQQLDDAIVFNKKHIIPTTMIKLEDNQLTITKNIPLRHHACIASIQFNFTIRETSISFSMFGSNAYGRLDHIKLDEDIALTAAGIQFIKGPSINTKEREVAYSAKIKDNQQVNLIIQNINKSIDTSFEIIRGDLQLPLAKVKLMKQRLYILKQYDQLAIEEFKELANVAKIMLIEPTKFFNTSSTSSNLNKSHIEVLSKILDFCDARELFEIIVLHEHKLPKELVKHFFEKSGTNVNKLLIAFLQHTTETEQVLLLIYLILNNDPTLENIKNILKNQLTNFKKSMQTSTKWWQELNPEVQSSLLPKLFSPQISLNPELNLIVLAILQDPLKLLIQLNAEDHPNFVSSLFNLLESKDSELQATIINILKMPLQLLRYLNSEAHSNFILRIFDLRNNEDPKIQALLQNTLKQSFELLIHLKSPVHSSFILSFFNLLNTSEPALKSIVLNILKNPSELLTYLKPPAHDNFVTRFFDLKDSKDLEVKLIIQDTLNNPIKLLTYLKSNAHHRFISCLFDLKNSQEPEQKLIALNILKDPLGLLPHLAPEAHPSFISNFFNLQNSKTPELQSTILQLLRNPLELLSRLSTEAYPSFVTSLFDLYNSKDLEIKSTVLNILKDPLDLLAHLRSHRNAPRKLEQ
ncbi:PEP/pyruvate-binding domain-containing protein [Candidatus Tisiphia endosymbiont of Beris chalybata]|uniref:PEP/pyruvate-binding domain-containing protein n=1 Tax=Candidatus Tisiphia endosymbiont of Beris chalybata TaxID=3066262 RepID=UPI00312C916C